jgi:2-polyprenyl-3-methyl-5-hydroxy-6-metoxy-1,4-benzoquinol methylase
MSHKGTVIYKKDGTKIIDCEVCGFKHVHPLPSESDIETFYKKTYFNEIRDGKKGRNMKHFLDGDDEANAEMNWLKSTLYQDVNEVLSGTLPEGSRNLCDVGCGSGFFLKYMCSSGWKGIGIEPSENACYESGNLRIVGNTLEGFIAENPEYHHFFDVVTLFGVLEHAANPVGMIQSVKNLLNKDGILFISVPNDFSVLQESARNSLNSDPWWISIPDHINYFSMNSLKNVLMGCGFSIIETTTDFPMELFLLMGDNYIADPLVGSRCHQKRKQFELSLNPEIRRKLYRCFINNSMGRNCMVYARISDHKLDVR